jgi:hypothetical protein
MLGATAAQALGLGWTCGFVAAARSTEAGRCATMSEITHERTNAGMQELRERLEALRDRIAHVLARL